MDWRGGGTVAFLARDRLRLKMKNTDLRYKLTVALELRSSMRDEVLRELVSAIPELKKRPDAQETLLKALQDRESLHSTGIGDGIALPHARNALVGLVDHTVIVLGRHAQGIPFGAIDGKPAQLFFLLAAPTVTDHLAVLARISRVLLDGKLRQSLLTVQSEDKAAVLLKEAGL